MLQVVVGILLIGIGIWYGGAALLATWCGMSFLLCGLGHWRFAVCLLRKRADGRLCWWSKLLHLPFLLFSWGVWHLWRVCSREPAYQAVNDSLVLGRRLYPRESPPGISNWVDLTTEFDEPYPIMQSPAYLSLPILDHGVLAAAEVTQALQRLRPGATFIHCAQGHGRTALFALCLLAWRGQIASCEEGMTLLRQYRPGVTLNRRQRAFVDQFISDLQPAIMSERA